MCRKTMILTAAACVVASGTAQAVQRDVDSTVATLRYHTTSNLTIGVREYAVFQMSAPLAGGCVWLWIAKEDKQAFALLVSAKLAASNVKIFYEDALETPWGDPNTCGAVAIQLD